MAARLGGGDPQADGLPARRQWQRAYRFAPLLCRVNSGSLLCQVPVQLVLIEVPCALTNVSSRTFHSPNNINMCILSKL